MTEPLQEVPIKEGSRRCPTCGMGVRLIRRQSGAADHYEALPLEALSQEMVGVDKKTSKKLKKLRKGKRTVALVGMAPTSASLAPFNDKNVEIWACNEMHHYPWMKRWDRWFQMHGREYFTRKFDKRGYEEHYDWLKTKHGKPIYMQYKYDEIPDSVEYPLGQIIDRFFSNARKGDERFKYFTSTMPFQVAMALYEDFDRIEIYGMEMAGPDEYVVQRPCGEFWLGQVLGMGKELYLPPNNQMLQGGLYGYQGILRLLE